MLQPPPYAGPGFTPPPYASGSYVLRPALPAGGGFMSNSAGTSQSGGTPSHLLPPPRGAAVVEVVGEEEAGKEPGGAGCALFMLLPASCVSYWRLPSASLSPPGSSMARASPKPSVLLARQCARLRSSDTQSSTPTTTRRAIAHVDILGTRGKVEREGGEGVGRR